MAIMYPDKPKEFSEASFEGDMFDALSKLPDSYYVFHSLSIVTQQDGVVYESETDFVVFHPEKGVLCIEAKAGEVNYSNGAWRYRDGKPMSHDGPYMQASRNKWKLYNYCKDNGLEYIVSKCKFLHAVWFPFLDRNALSRINMPPEADHSITLTKESIDNIEADISKIFSLEVPNHIKTSLLANDTKAIINRVLAPTFNLVSIAQIQYDRTVLVFKNMLKEQLTLLNYLEEQKTAVINGMAGTGKTVMAIEKARRLASKGERVLFLCYNRFLKEHLQNCYFDENIAYYTIDGFACSLCNTIEPNYPLLKGTLEEMYLSQNFPFRHVIIDEGQDFGKLEIENNDIVELLKCNVNDSDISGGTFYLFYDKNQMIQADRLPQYIREADCKLTLYRNCRNTENIARTTMRLLGIDRTPALFEGATKGVNPELYVVSDEETAVNAIDKIIEENTSYGVENIKILTCKTEAQSILSSVCDDGYYTHNNNRVSFTTCRKFKGLESDIVIVVDVNREFLEGGGEKILYVGSSRARHKLYLICDISSEDIVGHLQLLGIKPSNNPYKKLAVSYNARYKEV